MKRSGILLLALLSARVAPAAQGAPTLDLRLAYISQTLGEIEPCG